MEVTEDEAPTTPDTTTLLPASRSAEEPSLQVHPPSSMLLMEPERKKTNYLEFSFYYGGDWSRILNILSSSLYSSCTWPHNQLKYLHNIIIFISRKLNNIVLIGCFPVVEKFGYEFD